MYLMVMLTVLMTVLTFGVFVYTIYHERRNK